MKENVLRKMREALYHRFDDISGPSEFFALQKSIAEDIIKCEKYIAQNDEDNNLWKEHLQKLLSLGDSIAWLVLDPFTIRQLGKYDSVRTSLANQEDVIVDILNKYQGISYKSIYLIADITRCITVGDIIEVITCDRVKIIECKSSKPEIITADNILQGRNGRQFSKAFWLQAYMKTGFGKLYGNDLPSKVIEIETSSKSYIELIPNLIDECIKNKNGFAFVQVEPGLIYMAQKNGFELNEEIVESLPKLKKPVIASTARLIEEPKETIFHAPPLVLNIPFEYRIMLQEVDVNIIGILDLNYIQEVCTQMKYQYSETQKGEPQLSKDGKCYIFHIRFINDILINFIPVKNAIETMVLLFENIEDLDGQLTLEEKKQMERRPLNRKEFVKYLEDNYVLVAQNEDGKMLKAYTMRGEIIFDTHWTHHRT
jgi:hypothetical protein